MVKLELESRDTLLARQFVAILDKEIMKVLHVKIFNMAAAEGKLMKVLEEENPDNCIATLQSVLSEECKVNLSIEKLNKIRDFVIESTKKYKKAILENRKIFEE